MFVTTTDLDQNVLDAFPDAQIIYVESGKIKKN